MGPSCGQNDRQTDKTENITLMKLWWHKKMVFQSNANCRPPHLPAVRFKLTGAVGEGEGSQIFKITKLKCGLTLSIFQEFGTYY